ncbi:unnamed protein product [Cyprideis torosa]|uniref:CNH domain-containing protein n=1 Tax=Cyprideis torosa TaxID=163714 RepID=A0A7R8ZGQ2_9CRUS|nr:unnamed protein product [Cyprideis torosa]CAG0880757.1 unnamed protein product [Cyprideis torosa]
MGGDRGVSRVEAAREEARPSAGGQEHSLCLLPNLDQLVTGATVLSRSQLSQTSLIPIEEGLVHIHLFDLKVVNEGRDVYLVAAQDKLLYVFKWDWTSMSFSRMHRVKLLEGACALTMRTHSVLVAAEKFYEVDLMTADVEPFLDEADQSLIHVTRASFNRCVPFKVYAVGQREFLVCFHEVAIFVDEYGARSRKEDLRYKCLPVSIEYQAPYLYLFQFNAIEVFKLRRDTCTSAPPESRCMYLPQPMLLGPAVPLPDETPPIIVASPSVDGDKTEIYQLRGRSFFRLDSLESLATVTSGGTADSEVDHQRPSAKRSNAQASNDPRRMSPTSSSSVGDFSFSSSINEIIDSRGKFGFISVTVEIIGPRKVSKAPAAERPPPPSQRCNPEERSDWSLKADFTITVLSAEGGKCNPEERSDWSLKADYTITVLSAEGGWRNEEGKGDGEEVSREYPRISGLYIPTADIRRFLTRDTATVKVKIRVHHQRVTSCYGKLFGLLNIALRVCHSDRKPL